MKKILLLFSLFTLGALYNSVQAQTGTTDDATAEALGITLTGDPIQDAVIYDQAKTQLEQNDPTKYQQIFKITPKPVTYITFPGFTPTGNATQDAANYKQAKEDLYNNNPTLYQQYFSNQSTKKHHISTAEYNTMPLHKQQHIDNNPQLYQMVD
ncbi:MAG: hypothetical protein GY810_27175 [Aureispira sp.]|nr:hypothetical protein [Aureispira sp.]